MRTRNAPEADRSPGGVDLDSSRRPGRACHDEPRSVVHDLTTDLRSELLAPEVALEHLMPRSVIEDALLPLLWVQVVPQGRIDHYQLPSYPTGLCEEQLALVGW